MLWFHFLSSLSIRILTFALTKVSQIGERTYGACCLGSQLLPHMPTILPFPILHLQPLTNTSLPCKILLHAYDPPPPRIFSFHDCTLWEKPSLEDFIKQRVWVFQESPCLLSQKWIIKQSQVSKPHSPFKFGFCQFFPFNQWIFLLSPFCPHQNFLIKASISWQSPNGNLKHPMAKVGMTWMTALINTSWPAWDKSFPFQLCNFLHIFSLMRFKLCFFLLQTKDGRPKYCS